MVCKDAKPTGGVAEIHHADGFPGFLNDPSAIQVSWSGFYDECTSNHTQLTYHVCIGTLDCLSFFY